MRATQEFMRVTQELIELRNDDQIGNIDKNISFSLNEKELVIILSWFKFVSNCTNLNLKHEDIKLQHKLVELFENNSTSC